MKVLQAFGCFSRDYLMVRAYSQVTIDGYWWVVKSFVDAVGNIETNEIDKSKLGEWIFSMDNRGNTRSTMHTNVSRFKVFIEYLNLEGSCTKLLKDEIKAPRKPKTLPIFTTADVIDKMIAAAPSIRDKAIISVLFSTGLRNSELRNLVLDDIEGKNVYVREGKGLKDRMVQLDNRSKKLLDCYLSTRVDSDPFLFRSQWQQPIAKSTLRFIVANAAKRAGVAHAKPHAIRHGCGTHLMRGGAHLRVIQDYLGHSDPKVTEIYTHVTQEDIKVAHSRIFDNVAPV